MTKVYMVCLGLKPGTAGWSAQTNPRSYDSTPKILLFYHQNLVFTETYHNVKLVRLGANANDDANELDGLH